MPPSARSLLVEVTELLELGDTEQAAALAAHGLERFDGNAALWALAAEVEQRRGHPAEAARLLRGALTRSRKPRPRWQAGLAKALADMGAPPIEVDDAYRSAVTAAPSRGSPVKAWVLALHDRGLSDHDVEEALLGVQLSTNEPLPGVLLFLMGSERGDQLRDVLEGHLEIFRASDAARACRLVWDSVSALRPPNPLDCAAVLGLSPTETQLFFAIDPLPVRPLGEVTRAAESGEDGLSLEPGALRRYADEFLQADTRGAPTDRVQFATESARQLAIDQDRFLGFQTRALREGVLRLPDPHTGRDVAPFDNLVIYGRTAYSFGTRELSVLLTAGESKRAAGIYLASQHVVVDLGASLDRYFTVRRMATLLSHLLVRAARMPDRFAEAVRADLPLDSRRTVAVVVGAAQNFAHHLWNYYPALERIVDLGLAGRVDEVLFKGSEFFGPIDALFPEFSSATLVDDTAEELGDPHPYSPRHLIVQPGSVFVPRSLTDRVCRVVRGLPRREAASEPVSREDRTFPVIWIGLRVGSRSWVDQDTGIPEVIARIHELWPEAIFLLDGYSYPVGRDEISHRWSSQIEELGRLADRIRLRVSRPIQVLNLVGNSLRESALWAREVDTYLTPVGTSQHKVGWFSTARGVIYAARSLERIPLWRRPGAYEAEGQRLPVYVFGDTATPGERRSLQDTKSHTDNLVLDVDALVEALLFQIDERRLTRSRPDSDQP